MGLLPTNVYSQSSQAKRSYIRSQMVNPTDPYNLISKTANDYFRSLTKGTATEEDEELQEFFTRWDLFIKERNSYPNVRIGGDVYGARAVANSLTTITPRCTTGGSLWSTEGPLSSNKCNQGIAVSVAFDPNNPNTFYAGSNTSGLFKTVNGGTTWNSITDNFNFPVAAVNAIAVDPSNSAHIFAGVGAGVFHDGTSGIGIIESINGGASWNIVTLPGLTINHGSIAKIVYATANIIYAISDIKVYKSSNNGATWFDITPTSGPLSLLSAGYTATIGTYVTTAYNHLIDLEVDNTNPNNVFISTDTYTHYFGSKLFGTNNGGTTWTQINLNSSVVWDAISIDFTPADPGTLYVYYSENLGTAASSINATKLDKTSDFGTTWTTLNADANPTGFGFWNHVFEMANSNLNFFIGGVVMYKFTVSGSSYSGVGVTDYFSDTPPYQTHGDIRAMVIRSNGTTDELLTGCDGGVIMSNGNGNAGTWLNKNGSGLNISQYYSISTFNKSDNIVATPQDDWTKIRNAGVWDFAPGQGGNTGESYWSELDYTDDNIVYISGNNGLVSKSTDGGLTYSSIGSPPSGWNSGGRLYIDPTNHNNVYSGVSAGPDLYKYDNLASSWVLVHSPVTTAVNSSACGGLAVSITPVRAIAIAPSNPNVMYEGHEGATWACNNAAKLYRSTDGGASWIDITANLNGAVYWAGIKNIIIDPLNEKRIFICFSDYWSPSLNRVLVSNDGGNTFADMSAGLSSGPVNHLVYQNGTDDVIYAATDYGVYRWNKSTSTWDCFNNGLPPTIVKKVEINYCQNKLYASTYGRGVYSCQLPQAPDFHITTSLVNSINSTNILTIPPSYNQTFGNRVIVDPGVYMKIQGTMNFVPNVSFVVAKKSHVVLTGTLNTNCPLTWPGVQLGGDITKNQNYSGGFAINQGIIEVLNGGTIQNADNAITTGTFDAVGNLDWNSLGGVISAANANFIDNVRDIQYLTYPFLNRGKFINCKFETKNQLLGGNSPQAHVSMWNVSGIIFSGNDFKYSAGNAYPYGNRGYGIGSIDAKYTVKGLCTSNNNPCTVTDRGTFEDLNGGITATNSNPLQTITVRDCDFNRNYTEGAYFKGVNYISFVKNNFIVGNSILPSGLYLDNCKYYSVQNNTINQSLANFATGIYATNSGAGAHLIYKNTIHNMNVAIGAQNDNSGNSNFIDGLKIKCNVFNTTANNYDVALMGNQPSVGYVQGTYVSGQPDLLAGNKYNAPCGNENKWYVDLSAVKSIIHSNNSNAFSMLTPQPSCSDLLVLPFTAPVAFNPINQCLDISPVANPGPFNPNISTQRTNLINVTSQVNSLVDGGNTQSLLTLVNGNSSPGNIKNGLTNASPYLSDAVLNAYFSNSVTPYGHIKQIHEINAPVSSPVWQLIVSKNLPSGIMNNIVNNQNANKVSQRQMLEAKLSEAQFNLELAYIDKIRYYLNDTTAGSQDTAIKTIIMAGFKDSECQVIAREAATKGTTLTAVAIDLLHGGAAYVDDFCKFQKLVLQLNQNAESCYKMQTDLSLKQQIEAIANDYTKEGYCQAQALLKQVFNYTFPVLRLIPETQGSNRFLNQENNQEELTSITITKTQVLNLFPNPSNGNVTIILKGDEETNASYQLNIQNTLGQIVFSKSITVNKTEQLDSDTLSNGIYIVSLLQNNKLLKETKLIIMK